MRLPSSCLLRHSAFVATLALSLTAQAQGTPGAPAAPPAPPPAAPAPVETAPPAPNAAVPLGDALTGMAKAEYGAARILYDDGDYQGALQKLKSAFDLSKDPRLLWNMAACEKNLRHYASVAQLIDRYLGEGAAFVTADDRAAAGTLLDTVRGFVTDLTVESNEGDAVVFLDEVAVAKTPMTAPLHVDMGSHKVRVSKPGFVDAIVTQDFPGGQPLKINASLVPERHEGRLRITAAPSDVIQVDGKVVGTGVFDAVLASGHHSVFVSARGKHAQQSEVVVQDNDLTALQISLQDESKQVIVMNKGGVPAWVWITGGVLLAGGGVGAYFLLKPHGDPYQQPTNGAWGAINL